MLSGYAADAVLYHSGKDQVAGDPLCSSGDRGFHADRLDGTHCTCDVTDEFPGVLLFHQGLPESIALRDEAQAGFPGADGSAEDAQG